MLGKHKILSFWKAFRLIFIIFSLYLLGDIFYRWDGFSYYASFFEFLPSVALITILWGIVAVLTSAFVWTSHNVIKLLCFRKGLKIKIEHFLLLSVVFMILGAATWVSKRHLVHHGITLQVKLLIFLFVAFISILFTWSFRNQAERWIELCQDRITPLVCLFGVWVIFSIPLVTYYAWIKQEDHVAQQQLARSYPSDMNRPNILLVTFDAMTARNMSAYGYRRPTTPFISEWANTASLFTRLEAESNYTRSTVASLMTGKRVWSHQIYHSDQRSRPVNIKTENLALLLKNHGYFNISIMTSSESSDGAIKEYFDLYPLWNEFDSPVTLSELIENLLFKLFGNGIILYDWFVKEDFVVSKLLNKVSMDTSSLSRRPNVVFDKFLEILDHGAPTPYFAWIHLWPPHFPYLPPDPYKGIFESSSELRTYKSQHKLHNEKGKFDFINEKQPVILRARYDEYIRYCDDQFREFVTRLETKNRLKNTVIILSSDHGESFDHGYFAHGGPHLFESMTHIPLIIKEFGQAKGRIINELVEQIDIPATILDLAVIDIPSWMEGRSILPLLRDNELPSKPIFSMNFENNRSLGHRITTGTIVVWVGDYKLIHYLDTQNSLLFNLKQDPDELNNLRDKEIERSQYLLGLIQDALNNANEAIIKGE